MFNIRTVGRLLIAGLIGMSAVAFGQSRHEATQDPILAGREAFLNRDIPKLEKLAQKTDHHILADYLQFWLLELRLGTALRQVPAEDYHRFMTRGEGPLQDQFQVDWLKAVVQAQDWKLLLTELPHYSGTEPELACGMGIARGGQVDSELQSVLKQIWLSGKPFTPTCESFFTRWLSEGRLSADEVFIRYSTALAQENFQAARSTARALFAQDGPVNDEDFSQVAKDPARWLTQIRGNPPKGERSLALYALVQVAKTDLPKAVSLWEALPPEFAQTAKSKGWARIGTQASMQLDPYALTAYRKVRDGAQDADLEWWVRAALRLSAWDDVLTATNFMSESMQSQSVWRYWRARALSKLGKKDEAASLYSAISQDHDFYGQLAQEELGGMVSLPASVSPSAEEVAGLRAKPAMQRALALAKLGLQKEAVKEWAYVTQGLRDDQLLVAAEIARQSGWYERMIASGEKMGPQSDPSFRYPLPFRETVRSEAGRYNLDEAWVYGLMRQESRFLVDARSRSGAMGLMQLMPTTARWVAQKMGIKEFKTSDTEDQATNIKLGSFYLHYILDSLGHPVLATAGYNAGPNRVRKWLDQKPIEGAIFCETIPVTETRDYVKKVMANANIYTARLGRPPKSLKSRLGTIPSMTGSQEGLDDLAAFSADSIRVSQSTFSKN